MIDVGDLVAVVKPTPCCGNPTAVGWHFVVEGIYSAAVGRCAYCQVVEAKTVASGHPISDFNVERLKRIPPLDELDKIKHEEEIIA